MRPLTFAVLLSATLAAPRRASAQEQYPLPPTTDCRFAAGDSCIIQWQSALGARERDAAHAAYTRGMRAFGGISLTLGVPQLVGGIIAATQATPRTENVGRSALWTLDGALMTITGGVLTLLPFDRPRRPAEGVAAWLPAVVFSLASAGHVAYAAGSWIAPPQDVLPWMNHVFAASMSVNAVWFGTLAALSVADFRHRPRGVYASLSPYAHGAREGATFGLAGRF